MRKIGLYEARSRFAEIVSEASRGETVLLTKNGEPVAQLTAVPAAAKLETIVEEILALPWTLGESPVALIRSERESRG